MSKCRGAPGLLLKSHAAAFRNLRADAAHVVGAQAAIFSDHVRDRMGVGSLLLLVGLGEGFRSGNRKQFDDLGENVMFIWGGRAPAMNGSFTGLRQYYLTYKDYLDILRDHGCKSCRSGNLTRRCSRRQRFLQ